MTATGDFEGRAERLRAAMTARELDSLVITDLTNVRYLTGFAPTNGLCVVAGDERRFVTDFRYTERAEREVSAWEVADAERELLPAAAKLLTGRAAFDDAHLSVREHRRLADRVGEDVELVACAGLVEELRRVKEPAEADAIGAAAELADSAFTETVERGLAGRTERRVALDLEQRMRELGASDPSFPSIVAAGTNGALPHAEPGDTVIEPGTLVTIDWGAQLDGYCSDCTRTVAVGEIDDDQRAVYDLVLEAQLAGLVAVAADRDGKQIDAAAREVIEAAGHADAFGHGLGHGVGLLIHELPRLAPSSKDTVRAGDVVTIEPGVYLRGQMGVRIEDLVVVGEEGISNLSGMPKELQIVE